jgi:hypothetical protein
VRASIEIKLRRISFKSNEIDHCPGVFMLFGAFLTPQPGFLITVAIGGGGSLSGNVDSTGAIFGDCITSVAASAPAVSVPTIRSWMLLVLVALWLSASGGYLQRGRRGSLSMIADCAKSEATRSCPGTAVHRGATQKP